MKMKKRIVALLLLLVVFGNMSAMAMEMAAPVQPAQVEDSGISPQAEETVWCTRVHNGMLQKRLWSITNGRWLTEWIDVSPVLNP